MRRLGATREDVRVRGGDRGPRARRHGRYGPRIGTRRARRTRRCGSRCRRWRSWRSRSSRIGGSRSRVRPPTGSSRQYRVRRSDPAPVRRELLRRRVGRRRSCSGACATPARLASAWPSSWPSTAILVSRIPGHTTAEVIFIPLDFAICWFAGFMLRRTADQAQAAEARAIVAERDREADALRAVVEERTRIARELHDIVGHSVSVMTVQTPACVGCSARSRSRSGRPCSRSNAPGARRSPRCGGWSARCGIPTRGPTLAPQPSLSRVDALVAHARETGLSGGPRDRRRAGPAPGRRRPDRLPAGPGGPDEHDQARGGEPRRGARPLRRRSRRDRGVGRRPGRTASASNGGGHGLVGMRERVSIYGGELEAGPRAEGGYRLRARLPVTT